MARLKAAVQEVVKAQQAAAAQQLSSAVKQVDDDVKALPSSPTASPTASPSASSSSSSSSSSSAAPASFSKQSLLFDGHTFNFCFLGSIYCLAMCDSGMRQSTVFQFLSDVMSTFLRVSNDGRSTLEGPTLKAMTDVLLQKMETYSEEAAAPPADDERRQQSSTAASSSSSSSSQHAPASPALGGRSQSSSHHGSSTGGSGGPDADDEGGGGEGSASSSSVQHVRRELDGVKDVLLDNLDRVMNRGEALESLVDRSAQLNDSSDQFRAASTRLRRQLRWQQLRTAITVMTMSAIIVYVIAAWKCGVALNAC
jgi:hypothetical protein